MNLTVSRLDLFVNDIYTSNMEDKREDHAMAEVRRRYNKSGLTLHDLGVKMGYTEEIARQSAWQFMKTDDPRISMLERFAQAMEIPMQELIHPVRRGLRLIMIPLRERMPLWKDAIRKTSVQKMVDYLDPLLERCRLYQKCCPEYFPETKQLAPYFKDLEDCRVLPTDSKSDKKAFISKASECLTRLSTEVEKMLEKYSS